ncbi:hypothetical protein ACFQY5_31795 [Paeniroseomonas aquatica]|uniref:hypothetical protein n=1 Tax=Paeniroseomonas aquatica TaxID=373043 RepID=UPI0036170E51
MSRIPLTMAMAATDRTRPVLDGRVAIGGVDLNPIIGEPEDIFRRALRDKAFGVTELSMGSHIVTTARGDSGYVGIPVFLSRAFRHSAIYIRTDRGIRTAADLAGRTIGLPEYQQTAALWVRGILREHYGVDTRGIRWRIGTERIAITLPAGFDVAPLGQDLPTALAEEHRCADRAAPAGLPDGWQRPGRPALSGLQGGGDRLAQGQRLLPHHALHRHPEGCGRPASLAAAGTVPRLRQGQGAVPGGAAAGQRAAGLAALDRRGL